MRNSRGFSLRDSTNSKKTKFPNGWASSHQWTQPARTN